MRSRPLLLATWAWRWRERSRARPWSMWRGHEPTGHSETRQIEGIAAQPFISASVGFVYKLVEPHYAG